MLTGQQHCKNYSACEGHSIWSDYCVSYHDDATIVTSNGVTFSL